MKRQRKTRETVAAVNHEGFAYPMDARYCEAARKVRAARRAHLEAVMGPWDELAIRVAYDAYQDALREVRAEEDRIMGVGGKRSREAAE